MENKANTQFDVVIAGGGLSGALAALSLSKLKHSDGRALTIAIVEANAIHTDAKLTFDARVLALSHGSAAYLDSLGAWQSLVDDAAPIKKIHISDRGHYGKARLTAADHHVSALGYVIEMALIGKALLSSLKDLPNITWFCPDSIKSIEWQTSHVDIELSSSANTQTSIQAKLLLGCDGAQSSVRKFAGINSSSKPYEQSALIANVSMEKTHQNCAYERFTETGPIAMLPLTGGATNSSFSKNKRCSLVWTLTPEQASEMAQLNDGDFNQALEHAFGSWLGKVEQAGKRDVYPLNLVQANEQVFHRTALIGNASHAVHPIAGQGFNLGVRDVEQLSTFIAKALENKQDIGQFDLLSQYAEQRKGDHQQVITITDSLVTLFSNQLPPLVLGRNIGLKVMNYLPVLKGALVNKLMGY